MSIWSSKHTETQKPWGHEARWCSPFGISGKLLYINQGHRNSLKYYPNKNQVLYCLTGHVKILAPKENEFGESCCDGGSYFNLSPGEYILIQSANPYRIEAVEQSVLIEVIDDRSSSYGAQAVILEDDYGRKVIPNIEAAG